MSVTPRPVVVTRPQAQAEPLAQRIAQAGRDPIVFPLLEIRPLPDTTELQAALTALERYAVVVFVSPNAIDAAFRLIDAWPAQVAIGVVGEGSRAALARHGVEAANATIFSPRDPRRSDSEGLLDALDIDALRGRQVLIVRGENGRELLADALRARGAMVHPVPAYRRSAPALDAGRRRQLETLLAGGADWIVTSSEALHNLVEMAKQAAGEAGLRKLQGEPILVPHARIAETARACGFLNVILTDSGDESLVAALQSRA
jgi:uroporphyrinogen-III synthase